jgi:hypothetical protein
MKSIKFTILAAVAVSAALAGSASAAVQYATPGSTYSQNFDTLVTSGTAAWANDSTLPGWVLYRQPAPGTAITTYTAGDGSSNAGAFYSFGTGSNAERALGGMGSGGTYFGSPGSGAVAGWIALGLTNGTGADISSFTVHYDGEQWRNGGNTSAQTMVLQYGFGSDYVSVLSWTAAGSTFNFASPTVGSTAAALDGNAVGNRVANIGGEITANWSVNSTLWMRWIENNDVGNDHGLAIDNVTVSTSSVPEPASMAILGLGFVGLIGRRRRH